LSKINGCQRWAKDTSGVTSPYGKRDDSAATWANRRLHEGPEGGTGPYHRTFPPCEIKAHSGCDAWATGCISESSGATQTPGGPPQDGRGTGGHTGGQDKQRRIKQRGRDQAAFQTLAEGRRPSHRQKTPWSLVGST
jgi:hypothetical protein